MPEKVEEDVAKIVRFHKKIGIGVSIDGTPQIHDYLRGRKGSFEKAIKTLEKLVHLRSKHSALRISISFTITPLNVTKIFLFTNYQRNTMQTSLLDLSIYHQYITKTLIQR